MALYSNYSLTVKFLSKFSFLEITSTYTNTQWLLIHVHVCICACVCVSKRVVVAKDFNLHINDFHVSHIENFCHLLDTHV